MGEPNGAKFIFYKFILKIFHKVYNNKNKLLTSSSKFYQFFSTLLFFL